MGRRDAHGRLYPDCPVPWHDAYDHPLKMATKAAARALLTDEAVQP
ncbi:hypothetical protein [Mycolicibacter kumamotonensis]|uniref:Uncharacterized protein n=1 Tax=Mycolicibacter kumamotonensis TaxID=354243 RepID=A0A7K3LDZ1_9MYCO|nr:hypothetical protein [Mycolicibacter kumamotonensis]NDJ90579.1 hypothetical protein [Mycolicibacter kumamotonensis]